MKSSFHAFAKLFYNNEQDMNKLPLATPGVCFYKLKSFPVRFGDSTNSNVSIETQREQSILVKVKIHVVKETQNWTKTDKRTSIEWTQIRKIKVEANHPDVFLFKYDFCDDDHTTYKLNLIKSTNRRRNLPRSLGKLKAAYSSLIPILLKKY
ncbi:hypothetical protein FQR65_LT10050 [Abscondita terminalis]|nr:hypothetical protein FQR65_LT10050 [Abscondita terminalis]